MVGLRFDPREVSYLSESDSDVRVVLRLTIHKTHNSSDVYTARALATICGGSL